MRFQKSNQHLEKELEKRKDREAELLAFSAKLSSSNAELTAERADWETKVTSSRDELNKKRIVCIFVLLKGNELEFRARCICC